MSDISKIIYLEVIDTTFSIDGVLGAFAFTLAIPLILIGNRLGALVVRQITVGNSVLATPLASHSTTQSIIFLVMGP